MGWKKCHAVAVVAPRGVPMEDGCLSKGMGLGALGTECHTMPFVAPCLALAGE